MTSSRQQSIAATQSPDKWGLTPFTDPCEKRGLSRFWPVVDCPRFSPSSLLRVRKPDKWGLRPLTAPLQIKGRRTVAVPFYARSGVFVLAREWTL